MLKFLDCFDTKEIQKVFSQCDKFNVIREQRWQ